MERELNPWLAAEARFNEAAELLGMDEGMQKMLRTPSREITVYIPVMLDDGPARGLHRLSRAALDRARPGQGRHPLRARCHTRRSTGAGILDDVEVRRGEHPIRRRQRWRHLRSVNILSMGELERITRRYTAEIIEFLGPETRRARSGHEHERAGDGLDHGHVFHAHAAHGDRGGDGQADGVGRIARAAEATGRGCMIATLEALKRWASAGGYPRGDPGLSVTSAAWRRLMAGPGSRSSASSSTTARSTTRRVWTFRR
jgi:glutamate dehydrogenase (NAD(P)+)